MESQRRDGFFGVVTSVKTEAMNGEEIYERYRDLWRVEDAFGEIKGPLETPARSRRRPRGDQSDINVSMFSCYTEAIITRELRKAQADFTVGELFRALNQVHAIPVDVRGTRAWVRNEMKGTATAGYEILGLKLPDRVLKIEKVQNNEESEESVVAQKMAPVLESVGG